ncbi:hydrogen gas-evolving membrane-bound hydrogenase subunit E [Candidatus Margulisiibacteriota bacterium]
MTHGVADTGALNMVTSIYLNYRVYDTLGEATVFFASALGVFMLLRKDKGGGADE